MCIMCSLCTTLHASIQYVHTSFSRRIRVKSHHDSFHRGLHALELPNIIPTMGHRWRHKPWDNQEAHALFMSLTGPPLTSPLNETQQTYTSTNCPTSSIQYIKKLWCYKNTPYSMHSYRNTLPELSATYRHVRAWALLHVQLEQK